MRKITESYKLWPNPNEAYEYDKFYRLAGTGIVFCVGGLEKLFEGVTVGDSVVLSSVKPRGVNYYTLQFDSAKGYFDFWHLQDADTDNNSPWVAEFDRHLSDTFGNDTTVYAWIEAGD